MTPAVGSVPAGEAFSPGQQEQINRAIDIAERESGLRFAVYVGAAEGNPRTMARSLHRELPGPRLPFESDAGADQVHIERIGPERAAEFTNLAGDAFGWPEPLRPCMAEVVGRPGWHHYLAQLEGGGAVGTAALQVHGRSAWFTSASTRPEVRGRGVQSALIRHRLREATALGCTRAHVETAEDLPGKPAPSYRNVTRLGFELAYARPNWIWRAET